MLIASLAGVAQKQSIVQNARTEQVSPATALKCLVHTELFMQIRYGALHSLSSEVRRKRPIETLISLSDYLCAFISRERRLEAGSVSVAFG